MGTRVIHTYTDDIDGTDATATVSFSVEGQSYEIDLSEANAEKFNEALAVFIGHARKAEPAKAKRKTSAKPAAAKADSGRLSAIRAWAAENGYTVVPKGRIKAEIVAAYDNANPGLFPVPQETPVEAPSVVVEAPEEPAPSEDTDSDLKAVSDKLSGPQAQALDDAIDFGDGEVDVAVSASTRRALVNKGLVSDNGVDVTDLGRAVVSFRRENDGG